MCSEFVSLLQGPEIGMFELVAESVEDVKTLVEKFAEQESYTVEKGKKLRVKAVPFYNSYYQSPSEFLVSLENCSSLIFFFFTF